MAAPQWKVETDQPIPICEVRAKYTRALPRRAVHVISWKLYSCLFFFVFFVDVRCFITNIDKILTFEKEYHRCQNIED
jgi:hypothetical protein